MKKGQEAVWNSWTELSAGQRNNIIGELIGGEPIRRVEIVWKADDGKTFVLGSLPCMPIEKAKEWLDHARQSRENWEVKFDGLNHPFCLADQVHVREDVWHIRYSDTPGGGWFVVRALQSAGFSINISSVTTGWRVSCDDENPHHGTSAEVAETMEEAVCKLALRRLPHNLSEVRP